MEHCRHIDDVTGLTVHTIPEQLDPRQVPPLYVAMLDLFERTSHLPDLGIFDKIMEWVLFFSKKFPDVFKNVSDLKTTCKPFLKEM